MTVSRVLNGGSVGSETMARVHDAIRRLNYRPDQLARSLRTRQTRILGLIAPRMSDPFIAAIADSINKVTYLRGYALQLATTHGDPHLELRAICEMVSRRVDGLLVIPSDGFAAGSIAREVEGVKIVAIDQPMRGSRFDLVCVNDFDGAIDAVKHLISHGHCRIVCVSEANSVQRLRERQDGYSSAMAQHGLKPSVIWPCMAQESDGVIRSLLKTGDAPSAIFTTSWHAAIYVLNALGRLRIRIPDDVAVIGFDDFESANLLSVPLSVIRQPAAEMGRAATERIIEQLQSKPNNPSPQVLKLAAELILRRSCGCRP